MIDIIVEIGTPEQRELISEEARLLEHITQEFNPPLLITRIIVPENFEEKVNEIEGTSTYIADRTLVNAIGRMCIDGDGYAIIISPILYTERIDTSIRYFILFHEFAHVINKRDFSPISTDIYTNHFYTYSLSHMYDEYYADRWAYKMSDVIYPEKSQFWVEYHDSTIKGFLELITNPTYYEAIKVEINAFRYHANVDKFLSKIHVYFDPIAIVLAHTFAIVHHYPGVITEEELAKSKFINTKTINLMNYFSKKYEEKSVDFTDGNDLIVDFMTNFGIKFEDRELGPYCHVLDI